MLGKLLIPVTSADYVISEGASRPSPSQEGELLFEIANSDRDADTILMADDTPEWVKVQ